MSDNADRSSERWLFDDRVSLSIGLQRRDGRLLIGPGVVRFTLPGAAETMLGGRFLATRHLLAPLGVNWDIVLGRDEMTKQPILLTTSGRRAHRIIDALRSSGFDVETRRNLWARGEATR